MTTMLSRAQALLGATVADRYVIESILGTGGMGCVVGAVHRVTGNRVALKIVFSEGGSEIDRLLVEARAPGLVGHPNVVQIHDVVHSAELGATCLVQELLKGNDLRAELDTSGPLPWDWTVELLLPAIDALAQAHRHGVAHRDIKPENLFLSEDTGRHGCIVLDFGIARIAHEKVRLTEKGMTPGTSWYMSPEAIRAEAGDGLAADVWAMGAVLYEALCGELPFDGESPQAVVAAVIETDAVILRARAPEVPLELSRIVMRCLEKDTKDRYANMGELFRELRDFRETCGLAKRARSTTIDGIETERPASVPPLTTPRRSSRQSVATFVAIMTTALGIGSVSAMVTAPNSHVQARTQAHATAPVQPIEMLPVKQLSQPVSTPVVVPTPAPIVAASVATAPPVVASQTPSPRQRVQRPVPLFPRRNTAAHPTVGFDVENPYAAPAPAPRPPHHIALIDPWAR